MFLDLVVSVIAHIVNGFQESDPVFAGVRVLGVLAGREGGVHWKVNDAPHEARWKRGKGV